MPDETVHIRWMTNSDMPKIMAIEDLSYDDPCLEREIRAWCIQAGHHVLVAEKHGQVAGFLMYEAHPARLHLMNIAIHPQHRRCGIGRELMERLIGKLTHVTRERILCEVRETNLSAQMFFRAMGFQCIRILPDFYETVTENAYLMRFSIASITDSSSRIIE